MPWYVRPHLVCVGHVVRHVGPFVAVYPVWCSPSFGRVALFGVVFLVALVVFLWRRTRV